MRSPAHQPLGVAGVETALARLAGGVLSDATQASGWSRTHSLASRSEAVGSGACQPGREVPERPETRL